MECRNYQEHITAGVDNALSENEQQMLDAHLAQCPACKSEFEVEKLMRNIVRSRCKQKRTPGHVVQRIAQQLEAAQPIQTSWWKNIVPSSYVTAAIGFALACILVVVYVSRNSSVDAPRTIEASILPSNDIIEQSLANYLAVVKGEIKPTLISTRVGEMKSFFEGKTEFPVVVPTMSNCALRCGVLNEFGGKTLAHVVYNHKNSEIIYVYEACWETVKKGTPFHLAEDVQDELERTSWYSTTTPDGRSLVMWTNGKTLCSAVSKLDEQTLKDCLLAAR